MTAQRAAIESLLRARKLDVTLTSAQPWTDAEETAPTGFAAIDGPLHGGLRRGHLSEIVGAASSGRMTVLCGIFAAATARGDVVALIDTCDRFDPATAAGAGVDLSRLLWVREMGDATRALKAMNLVLQAGGFGVVAFDLVDVRSSAIRQFPFTTWMRISRVIESSQTVALLVGTEHIARSPGGVTLSLESSPAARRGRWAGDADRARYLSTLDVQPQITSAFATAPACAEAPAGKPADQSSG